MRRDLFGTVNPPFKSNNAVAKWIEEEAATASASTQEMRDQASRLITEIDDRISKLTTLLPGNEFSHGQKRLVLYYVKNRKIDFVFCKMPKLAKLLRETTDMEKATRFSQPELLAHVLVGTRLRPAGSPSPHVESRFSPLLQSSDGRSLTTLSSIF